MALFVAAKLLDTPKPTVNIGPSPFQRKLETCFKQRQADLAKRDADLVLDKPAIQQMLTELFIIHKNNSTIPQPSLETSMNSAIGVLKQIEDTDDLVDSSPNLVNDMLQSNILKLRELKSREEARLNEIELAVRKKKDEILKKSQNFLFHAEHMLSQVTSISDDIEEIRSSIISSNMADIEKAKFLESALVCVNITDSLWQQISVAEHRRMLDNAPDVISSLQKVFSLKDALRGRTRQVIESRISILTKTLVESLISASENTDSLQEQATICQLLTNFDHSNPDLALEILLKKRLVKFHHHFIRKSSALNLIDKPEWPLRWFLETTVEVSEAFEDADQKKKVYMFLAKKAREYFTSYRWALIKHPRSEAESDIFSLYLGRYLHAANQWKESFGSDSMEELLSDFRENTKLKAAEWRLLDEWIWHDRIHIQKAIEGVKNPFKPSVHNPLLCNIVVTVIDVFTSARARLEPVRSDTVVVDAFAKSCHDEILDDFMCTVRFAVEDQLQVNEISYIKESLNRLNLFLDSENMASGAVRKQLVDLERTL